MVADEHQVAGLKERIEAAGGIGDDEGLDSQARHHPHRKGHLAQGIAFVGMEAALAEHDLFAGHAAPTEAAGVAGAGGRREMRQLPIGEAAPALQPAGPERPARSPG